MFGTDASLFVDLFLATLLATLPAMLVAIGLVRRGKVKAHARVMTGCFVLFLVSVIAFEADVQFGGKRISPPTWLLLVHLCFAGPCLVLWIRQMVLAKTALANPAPHRRRGKQLIAVLCAAVATGVWLYAETFIL